MRRKVDTLTFFRVSFPLSSTDGAALIFIFLYSYFYSLPKQRKNRRKPAAKMADQQQTPCRILVMASGNGSNFQALIDNVAAPGGRIPRSRIVRLVVNRARAYATTRADRAGIPWEYFNLISNGFLAKGEKDEARVRDARERYDAALAEKVLGAPEGERPELVVLAGWMHVFGRTFLEPLEKVGIKVINLHPALPGEYPIMKSSWWWCGLEEKRGCGWVRGYKEREREKSKTHDSRQGNTMARAR